MRSSPLFPSSFFLFVLFFSSYRHVTLAFVTVLPFRSQR